MDLFRLLDRGAYLEFIEGLGEGRYPVREVEEARESSRLPKREFSKVLVYIARQLLEKHYTVLYPVEMIVVPRYPFSKQPLISWRELQSKDYADPEVARIKYASSRLGNLVNAGFLLRNFVLVDIDSKGSVKPEYADVETRRGYHRLFYMPRYRRVDFEFGGTKGGKVTLQCGGVNVELSSGSTFLGSHPLQSRYIEVSNGKVSVRSYKLVSRRAELAFRSSDLTPLESTLEDLKGYLELLFSELGCSSLPGKVTVVPRESEDVSPGLPPVNPKESRFNALSMRLVGGLPYGMFKEALASKRDMLPVCLRQSLYGRVERGYRYLHLRLLASVLPFFVSMREESIEELIEDWSSRTSSTSGEVRQWLYTIKYFTGKISVDGREVYTPSLLGAPSESWSAFESLGYCRECPLRESCLKLGGSGRRKLIVEYVSKLAGVAL